MYVMAKKEKENVSLRGYMQLHMLIHAISYSSGIDISIDTVMTSPNIPTTLLKKFRHIRNLTLNLTTTTRYT